MTNKDKWTGERLETSVTGEIMTEHLHRYAITFDHIKNKKVLDIACGEGYGVALMAKYADFITGVDINNKVIEKAKEKYKKDNIEFIQADAFNIPAKDSSFDIITCFETIEHLDDHDSFIQELKRVLKPSGILFISTPEKSNYSDKRNYKNPFHKNELYLDQFKDLLNNNFAKTKFYAQSSIAGSFIFNDEISSPLTIFKGDYEYIIKEPGLPPMYYLALASESEAQELVPGIFQNRSTISELIENEKELLRKTITYRTGNIILSPFKFIRSFFKR